MKGLTRHLAANIIFLLLAVCVVTVFSARRNYSRQIEQMEEYISVLSGRTAQHAGDVFRDKSSAITSAAHLYGELLVLPVKETEYLSSLE